MTAIPVQIPVRAPSGATSQAALTLLAAAIFVCTLFGSASSALEAKKWITYQSAGGGLSFDYPIEVFTVTGGDPTEALSGRTDDRAGRTFSTADGRATLQIASVPNLGKHSVSVLRNLAVAASYKNAKIDYNRVADNWYVISGTQGAKTFYERVHFSCNGRKLNIWTVIYPTAEGKDFEPMIDEMARRFRGSLSSIRCG
jgi:hypothetical protein